MTHITDLGYLLATVQGTGAAIGNMLVDYTHNEDKRYCNLTHCAALSLFFLKRKVAHFLQRPTFNTIEEETNDLDGETSQTHSLHTERIISETSYLLVIALLPITQINAVAPLTHTTRNLRNYCNCNLQRLKYQEGTNCD